MAQTQYSSVPTVEPTQSGTGASYQNVPEANANAFGANIGEASEKFGATAEDIGKQYMQRANEASANDTIVNQWAPTATKLSQDYYSKQGKDAVAGFQPYIDGLQKARSDMLQNATPAEAQILSQYMTRHIAQEYDGAMRHQVQQMDVYENNMSDAFVKAQSDYAVNAGSNPDMINTAIKSGTARIQVHGLDRGQSPEMIQQVQNDFVGKTSQMVVAAAVTRGDLKFANDFYNEHKDTIPGPQQLEIDKTLHSENMRSYGRNAVTALKGGNPIPNAPIGAPPQVKASLATSAQNAGVDPNETFAVASMESNFGTNTGVRGTVGQDKESAGKTIPEQTDALAQNWKKAGATAQTALGRAPEPWEKYTCYQQGTGGGPALLKAAQDNPMARAVDVIAPLYNSPKDALKAITGNGGNASMTAGQFLDYIKQSYNTHLAQTSCMIPQGSQEQPRDFAVLPQINAGPPGSIIKAGTPDAVALDKGTQFEAPQREASFVPDGTTPLLQPQQPNLSDAILAPHQDPTMAVQSGSNPTQSLINYDKVYPLYLQQANAIPDNDKRQSVISALEQDHAIYQAAASAHKQVVNNQAQELAASPKFTDISQVPPEMRTALADEPLAMSYLQNRAEYNLKNTGNIVSADKSEYGTGFYKALTKVLASPNDAGAVNDASQLYGNASKDGDLTIPGFDKLKSLIDMKKTPDGASNLTAMKNVFSSARSQITGTNPSLNIVDTKGDKLFNRAMALMLANYDHGLSSGKTPAQLLNPDSSDYIGSVVPAFKRSPEQQTNDMMKDINGITPTVGKRDLNAIISDVQSKKISSDAGKAEALKLGLISADNSVTNSPQVPQAGIDE